MGNDNSKNKKPQWIKDAEEWLLSDSDRRSCLILATDENGDMVIFKSGYELPLIGAVMMVANDKLIELLKAIGTFAGTTNPLVRSVMCKELEEHYKEVGIKLPEEQPQEDDADCDSSIFDKLADLFGAVSDKLKNRGGVGDE